MSLLIFFNGSFIRTFHDGRDRDAPQNFKLRTYGYNSMKTLRNKKTGILIILSAYFMMIGIPNIEEVCCRHFHHDDKRSGAANSVSVERNVPHYHLAYSNSHQVESLGLLEHDQTYLDTAGCCYHHSVAAGYPNSPALADRYSSPLPAFKAISFAYRPDSVSMSRENRVSSEGLSRMDSTIASLQTTVLLI